MVSSSLNETRSLTHDTSNQMPNQESSNATYILSNVTGTRGLPRTGSKRRTATDSSRNAAGDGKKQKRKSDDESCKSSLGRRRGRDRVLGSAAHYVTISIRRRGKPQFPSNALKVAASLYSSNWKMRCWMRLLIAHHS